MNSDKLDLAIDKYLEGELNLEESAQLEKYLASQRDSGFLSRELLVRDFLYNLPPENPPMGLIERLQQELPIKIKVDERQKEHSWWEDSIVALSGAQWAMMGPAIAVRAPLSSFEDIKVPKPRVGFISGMTAMLRLGVASGKVFHFGATSGKAMRFGLSSGRVFGSSISMASKVLKQKPQTRTRWRRAIDWIRR